MLRLDDLHPQMSGNKVFKLLPNLVAAKASGARGILTFGGAFSNHIHATAAAGQVFGVSTVGVVRADPEASTNPTLADAKAWGMQLHFVDRAEYRRRYDSDYWRELRHLYPEYSIVPEGGSNELALQGCAQLGRHIAELAWRDIVVACGTGTTAEGLALGVSPQQKVHAVAVLPGLKQEKDRLEAAGAEFWGDDVGAGYAVVTPALADFIRRFEALNSVQLDPVYTAKMALAASRAIASGRLDAEQTLLLHSGGLQGRRSLQAQLDAHWCDNPTCT